VSGLEMELKSRALMALSLASAVMMAFFFVLALFLAPNQPSTLLIIGGMAFVSLAAFGLNRQGDVWRGSWVYLIGFNFFLVLSLYYDPNPSGGSVYFLGIAVVLSGLLLAPAVPFLLTTISLIGAVIALQMTGAGPPTRLLGLLAPALFLYLLALSAWLYSSGVSRLLTKLRQISEEIRQSISVLTEAVSEIQVATSQVASGTSETAVAVSQTVNTVEEVRHASTLSAEKARNVSDTARHATEVAKSGRNAVADTAAAMEDIQQQMDSISASIVNLNEQSQAIGEIIATVNDLAEQSNLLAVNAAIEAAKAGEQGRGFAVVAQEIRNLAEQSKQATSQVRLILGDIQQATSGAVMATEQGRRVVKNGVKQSEEAGDAIQVLAETISGASQAATQIAASSQEQLVGMDQLASAMSSINEVSPQNVDSTRQAETAAQNLAELGQHLSHIVESYRI
jgi:hypothetical protein